jgi:hypothetical protein
MGQCHRCEIIYADDDLTIVYHWDECTILGVLCDRCVQAWLVYESGFEE